MMFYLNSRLTGSRRQPSHADHLAAQRIAFLHDRRDDVFAELGVFHTADSVVEFGVEGLALRLDLLDAHFGEDAVHVVVGELDAPQELFVAAPDAERPLEGIQNREEVRDAFDFGGKADLFLFLGRPFAGSCQTRRSCAAAGLPKTGPFPAVPRPSGLPAPSQPPAGFQKPPQPPLLQGRKFRPPGPGPQPFPFPAPSGPAGPQPVRSVPFFHLFMQHGILPFFSDLGLSSTA